MHIIMHSDQLYSTPREQTHSAQWVFNIFAIDIHKLPNIHTKIFFCGTHRNNVFAKCVWHQSERSPQWPVAVVVRRRLGRSWGGQCCSGLSPGYILTTLCPPGGPYIFVMCHLGMQNYPTTTITTFLNSLCVYIYICMSLNVALLQLVWTYI